MLTEMSQSQKNKYFMFYSCEVSKIVKFTESERNGRRQGLGEMENGELLSNGYKVSVTQDEHVLETCQTPLYL